MFTICKKPKHYEVQSQYEMYDSFDNSMLQFIFEDGKVPASDFKNFEELEFNATKDVLIDLLRRFGSIKISNKMYNAFVNIPKFEEEMTCKLKISGLFSKKTISIATPTTTIVA